MNVTDVSHATCGHEACAALKKYGSVVARGDNDYDGNMEGVDVTDVSHVTCGGSACAALKKDDSVTAWGDNDYGGNTGNMDVANVSHVTCGGSACSAIYNAAKFTPIYFTNMLHNFMYLIHLLLFHLVY